MAAVGFAPPATQVAPGPPAHAVAVTKSDTTILSPTRYIWVGGTGDLAVLLAGDSVAVTLSAVPAGTMLQICAQKVMSTNTTATLIIALW